MKDKDFLFSIIVPIYNTEKYIDKSLESIKAAIDYDCEVILVNDGSTDNSEEKVMKFLQKLPEDYKDNFVYTKKENKGLADTKNVGLKLARGKFISVVDSDDYISDDFYEIARRYVNDYDIIIYDVYVVFEKDNKLNYVSRAKSDWKENTKVALMNGAISGSSCNKIIRKELYDGHEFPVGKQYEDTAVTPFILSETEKIKYVPYPLYYYMQREKSIVATNTLMSAYYKISNNIAEVIKNGNRDIKTYRYVINEFILDRMLDMLTQDLKENNKEFLKNIQELANNSNQLINYIINSDMIDNIENHYSERQKQVVKKILNYLQNSQYLEIERLLKMREFINHIRRIRR